MGLKKRGSERGERERELSVQKTRLESVAPSSLFSPFSLCPSLLTFKHESITKRTPSVQSILWAKENLVLRTSASSCCACFVSSLAFLLIDSASFPNTLPAMHTGKQDLKLCHDMRFERETQRETLEIEQLKRVSCLYNAHLVLLLVPPADTEGNRKLRVTWTRSLHVRNSHVALLGM